MSSTQIPRRPGRPIPHSLREAIRERGQHPNNLWWGYSHKLRKHIHSASDVALCHLVLLELDTNVQHYKLEEPELTTIVNSESVTTRFDAEVILRSGKKQWHEVKSENSDDPLETLQRQAQVQLAREHDVEYCRFTADHFRARLIRIWNGLRMLQTIASVADQSLSPARLTVVSRLRGGRCALGELRSLGNQDEAMYFAAAFSLVLEGEAHLSLDEEDLTDSSVVLLKELS